MATLRDPVLFTKYFGVDTNVLRELGLFDPLLNADTKLFVDPLLLKESKNQIVSIGAVANFETSFGEIIKVLKYSTEIGDVPWRNADRLFTFKEPLETCLGYGDSTTHGSAIGPTLRHKLMSTAMAIIELGIQDPELFALMGLLEEGIGPDRISDMTTHAIKPALYELNDSVISHLGVTPTVFELGHKKYNLVRNPFESDVRPVLLLPQDILRELPVAHDWSDVADAADKNQQLRDRVNKEIGDLWAIRTRKDKQNARVAALRNRRAFETLMAAVGLTDKVPYDPGEDREGHYLWRKALNEIASEFPVTIEKPQAETIQELERVTDQIIKTFADLVENKGQWFHFWHRAECRHERAVQRFFFAVAEVYCKANGLDISPETDSGGGPVDFKFSVGYNARVLVEIKLSTGKVVSGYRAQLEAYKMAESTSRARYLIVDVGQMGNKLEEVLKLKNARLADGYPAADIIVVDGTRKLSASKRN